MYIGPVNKTYFVSVDDEHMYISELYNTTLRQSISDPMEVSGYVRDIKIYPISTTDINILQEDIAELIKKDA